MATGWETVTLGEVAELDIERVSVEPDADYRLVGVLIAGQGLFWRNPIRGRETSYSTLHKLRVGQLVMRKLTAWEGPITTVAPEFDGGYVSSEFPTFTLDRLRLIPEYMRLVCQQPEFHAEMRLRSTGTPERRNRLKPDDLLSVEIALPPLDEQLAIAAVVEAADSVVSALATEARALAAVLRAAHRDRFDSLLHEPLRIADVTDVVSGGTPSRDHPEYFGGDVPWVKSGDIVFRDLVSTPETLTQMGLEKSAAKLLPARTVVVAMYGQGATRGRCAVLQVPMTTNQACAAILPSPEIDERFVFHFLWSRYESLREESEGTSQPNLSKGVVEELRIPLPSTEEQEAIALQLDAVLEQLISAQAELRAASELRSSLARSLLAGSARAPLTGRLTSSR